MNVVILKYLDDSLSLANGIKRYMYVRLLCSIHVLEAKGLKIVLKRPSERQGNYL